MNPQEVFLDLLIAAMKDAAQNNKLTQLQTQIDPDGKGIRYIRLIVIPEKMDFESADGKPFGETTNIRKMS